MDALSPVTRRIVALGILLLVLITATNLLVLPLSSALRGSLSRLGDVRFERAQTEAIANRPPAPPASPLPSGIAIVAANPGDASARLAAIVRQKATVAGVTILALAPAGGASDKSAAISADFAVEGSELAVLAFLKQVESDRLLMRLPSWHMQVDDAHKVRLDGQVAAAWGQA